MPPLRIATSFAGAARCCPSGEPLTEHVGDGRLAQARLLGDPDSPALTGLPRRIWWGSTRKAATCAGQWGMSLMSSTPLLEDAGVPFDELQVEQIAMFRDA